jgi:hypothetical protein
MRGRGRSVAGTTQVQLAWVRVHHLGLENRGLRQTSQVAVLWLEQRFRLHHLINIWLSRLKVKLIIQLNNTSISIQLSSLGHLFLPTGSDR